MTIKIIAAAEFAGLKRWYEKLVRVILWMVTTRYGASIGVALYPEFGLDSVRWFKTLKYGGLSSQNIGGATIIFYDGEMGRRFGPYVEIEKRLRQGATEESLELHFHLKLTLSLNVVLVWSVYAEWLRNLVWFSSGRIVFLSQSKQGLFTFGWLGSWASF